MDKDKDILALITVKSNIKVKNRRIWEKTNGRCWYCGVALLKPKPDSHTSEQRKRWYTIDHATPRSRGGSLTDERNLLPCCSACNGDKMDMTVEEYRVYMIMRSHNVPYFSKTQLEYLVSIDVNILANLGYIFWGERRKVR